MTKKILIVLSFTLTLFALFIWLPNAGAYERYNDGCQSCHGSFTGGTSPKGSVFPSDDKHRMHNNSSYMNTECDLCHTTGDSRNPFIGSSDGTNNNPGLGCTGCHAESGLRAHHAVNSITQCAGCHPNDPTPSPENTMPVYYGTADTNADMPCNPNSQANINENWTIGDFEGIDNDGDNFYDGNDPDCSVAVCGDGILDSATEECDDGDANGTTTCGCQLDCTYTTAGTTCDDGLFCIEGESCDGTGTCQAGTPVDCDDGVGCTVDTCDETSDTCANTPDDASCDDGDVCTGIETCDLNNDCQTGTPLDCDDQELCTTDSCDSITGCANVPVECPVGEQCDSADGQCKAEPECTVDADCNDGFFCNGSETCDTATGTCQPGTPVDCDDGVDCTVDTCNEVNDECVNTPDNSACPDDGLFCTGDEICDSVAGCVSTGDPCPEGVICNEDMDTCDASGESINGSPWLMLLLDQGRINKHKLQNAGSDMTPFFYISD